MRRLFIVAVALLVPAALFAQSMQDRETKLLKSLSLSDSQISQVISLQKTTRTEIRLTLAHVRVERAQIAEAMAATSINTNQVNAFIDQAAQSMSQVAKARVAEAAQLQQIMGDDTYRRFVAIVHQQRHHPWRPMQQQRRMGPPPAAHGMSFEQGSDSAPADSQSDEMAEEP